MTNQLKKRVLSLIWRGGLAAILGFIAYILQWIDTVGLPEIATLSVIFIGNEITKYINKKYQLGRRISGFVKK